MSSIMDRKPTDEEYMQFLRVVEFADDPIKAIVSQYFYPESHNRCVYHYTRDAAFFSIIENNCIWSTPSFEKNDIDEMHDGANTVKNVLRDHAKQNDRSLAPLLAEFYDSQWKPPEKFPNFTVSFCEDGDASNLWMHYGGEKGVAPGKGFSIGFSVQHLINGTRLGYQFHPCRYNRELKHEIVSRAFETSIEWMENLIPINFHPATVFEWMSQSFHFSVLNMLPYFKNHTFVSEKEWRINITKSRDEWPRKKVQIQGGELEIIEFSIFSQQEKYYGKRLLPVFDVIAGSGVDEKTFEQARNVLDQNGYGFVSLRRSDCRLRP